MFVSLVCDIVTCKVQSSSSVSVCDCGQELQSSKNVFVVDEELQSSSKVRDVDEERLLVFPVFVVDEHVNGRLAAVARVLLVHLESKADVGLLPAAELQDVLAELE